MKVYISGPMTGLPQFNIPAFDQAKAVLEALGHDVVSPPDLDPPEVRALCLASKTGNTEELGIGMTHADFVARDLKILCDGGIETVFVLPGWEKSQGAAFETFVAYRNSIPIYEYQWALNWMHEDPVEWLCLLNAWQVPDLEGAF